MKIDPSLEGEAVGPLSDFLALPHPGKDAWQKARRTGKLTTGKAILAERQTQDEHAFSLENMRMREIERLMMHRHERGKVSEDDSYSYAEAAAMSQPKQDLRTWCRYWQLQISDETIAKIEWRTSKRKRMVGADACADMLNVTLEERTGLDIRTIGAWDVTREERDAIAKERKKELDRERQAAKRKAAGRKSRAEYEAESISKAEPWKATGMTRATWYRKGKPTSETSLSRIEVYNKIGDTPVSIPAAPAASPAIPAMPSSASTTMDNRLALGRAMGARGN